MAGRTTVKLTWAKDGIVDDVDKAMAAGLKAAGIHGRKAIKAELAGRPDSPEGGPPGKVSGNLQKAVTSRAFRKKGKYVGVDVGVPKKSSYDNKGPGKHYPGRMHAQAVRLARGFVGKDRRGRIYQQRGRPFAEPVLKREGAKMGQIVKDEARAYMPKPKDKR